MGAEPYWYYEKYNADVSAALQSLRQREFKAGRYAPVIMFPAELFPLGPKSPAPGAKHTSIEQARKDAGEDGTRSILDLDFVSKEPKFGAVSPISESILQNMYGTVKPSRAMVEKNMDFLEDVQRGHGVYIVLYKDGKPDGICFAGYSFD
jgi:hypothetical protein